MRVFRWALRVFAISFGLIILGLALLGVLTIDDIRHNRIVSAKECSAYVRFTTCRTCGELCAPE